MGFVARNSSLSPGIGGPESRRLVLLGAAADWVLGLIFWDDDDWGGCGADFLLARVLRSCEDNPLWCVVHSGLDAVDAVRLRLRASG